MAAGLADATQSQRIWAWLNGPTSSGKSDTFTRWVFAPRSDTVRNANWWDWVFLYYFGPISGSFDAQVEDGGAAIYVAYYDVMARLQSSGVDDAYSRFAQIIDRYRKPDHLAGGSPLYFGETQQHLNPGSVATDTPFPEAGLAASSFLNGFLGIQADAGALHIDPHLPQHATTVDESIYMQSVTGVQPSGTQAYPALPWAGVRNVSYRGAMLNVTERYCNAALDNVTVDVAARPGAQWPLTLTVAGFGAGAVATADAAHYDAATGLWTLTVSGPGQAVVQATGCSAVAVPDAPSAALLPLAAVVLYTARRRVTVSSLLGFSSRRR
jgi:MYXO-CTERM domain-containing protein